MPFPYVTPLKCWLVNVLEEREKNPNLLTFKMPYAILVSTAVVVKGERKDKNEDRVKELESLIAGNTNNKEIYRGCVISNKTSIKENYQLRETLLGYDLEGKPITIEGEVNRRISTPIIESIEIDTDGANNTLKTTRVNVKCFSLKQLEMFEVFFLRPGMHLLVEFGDSSLLSKKVNDGNTKYFSKPEQALITNNTSWDNFTQTYISASIGEENYTKNYYEKAEKSLGTYENSLGTVTDYSLTSEEGGVYSIMLEISQGNQYNLAISKLKPSQKSQASLPKKGKTKSPPKTAEDFFNIAKNQMISDLDLNPDIFNKLITGVLPNGKPDWKDDFFNWGVENKEQKGEVISLDRYVSLRFIVKILMNYSITAVPGLEYNVDKYNVDGKDIEYIPVRSHEYLISTSKSVIFPGSVPTFDVSDKDKNEIIFKKIENYPINGYSFYDSKQVYRYNEKNEKVEIILKDTDKGYKLGNALNIFILYEEVVKIWNRTFSRLDFINQIKSLLNDNSLGLFELHNASSKEGKPIGLLDFKIRSKEEKRLQENCNAKDYRFKPFSVASIVKEFKFTQELDDLVAGQSVFNNYVLIKNAIISTNSKNSKSSKATANNQPQQPTANEWFNQLEKNTYLSVDFSQYTTADGWYSINHIDVEKLKANKEKLIRDYNEGIARNEASKNKNTESSEEEQTPFVKLIKSKQINFKLKPSDKNLASLIYLYKSKIEGLISQKTEITGTKSFLTPIEVTVTIDGISGFTAGEYFKIDGVPETYNRDGVFQITNIKHNISSDGWSTELTAQWLITN